MKLPKEKSAAAARDAKRRLENPSTEAQKAEKAAVEAERLCKIQRTAYLNSERLRAKVERRNATGAKGLAAEASRKSTRRKSHSLTIEEKAENARADAERRSVTGTDFLAAKGARKSAHSKINPLTDEQKAKKSRGRCSP